MSPAPGAAPQPSGFLPRLAQPPRHVPAGLRARFLLGGMGVVAWLWLGLAGSLSAALLKRADLTSWLVFRGPITTVEGTSLGCEDTGASEGGSKRRRGRPIYANRYTFTEGGVERTGTSYAPGACLPEGRAVLVQHPAGNADVSRIGGMRRRTFGPAVAFLSIFPIVGLALVVTSLVQGRRQLRLLRHGRLALGTLLSTEATNVKVNKRRVMKLRFDMVTDRGTRHEVVVRSHLPGAAQDDPKERLLYDPDDPQRVAAWDLLSPRPAIDHAGELEAPGAAGTLLLVLLPAAAVAAIGVALAMA